MSIDEDHPRPSRIIQEVFILISASLHGPSSAPQYTHLSHLKQEHRKSIHFLCWNLLWQ